MSISGSNSVGSNIPGFSEKLHNTSTSGEVTENKSSNPTEKKHSRKEIERELENLNKFVQSSGTHLKFTLHEKLNEYYVQVVDDVNQTVVREIPSKKIMDMVAHMYETIGIFVDEKR